MKEKQSIGTRLKKLRTINGYSQGKVAQKLFISQSAYSLVETDQHGINSDHIIRVANIYNVTADYILTGDKNLVKMTTKNGFMPLLNTKAHAGHIKNLHKDDTNEHDYEYYKIPGYNPTQDSILIEIEGESMEPTVMSGDVLICQTQHKLEHVLDGSIVIVITKDALLNKRISKHENDNYFWLEGDNPEDNRKEEIKKADILKLLMVRGKVSKMLIPSNELSYKGKIKTFEESLKALNKEVYSINKKLENHLNKK